MEMKLQSYDDYKLSRDFTFFKMNKVFFRVGNIWQVPWGKEEEPQPKGWTASGG